MDETCQDIAAEFIGSEPVLAARPFQTDRRILLDYHIVIVKNEICKD